MWASYIRGFRAHLNLERGLSGNSIEAYTMDIEHFSRVLARQNPELAPWDVGPEHLDEFVTTLHQSGLADATQARAISGIRSFYRYLREEGLCKEDPSRWLDNPKLSRKLPVVLSVEEIDAMIAAIDMSSAAGHRDKAIIETLYGCGLRVSELINLAMNQIIRDAGFLRIIGKGDKQRLVPIGSRALKEIDLYLSSGRPAHIAEGHGHFVFLNQRGRGLSRVMVFQLVRKLAEQAGIQKVVSPHTFRHSFATHLMEGGADLRAIQQMLGHESITTTEIYTHIDREYLRETVVRFHPHA